MTFTTAGVAGLRYGRESKILTKKKIEPLALCRECDKLKPASEFVFGGEEVDWCKECYAKIYDMPNKYSRRGPSKKRRRDAIIQESGETIDRQAVIERDRGICHICGRKVKPGSIHIDHIIPLAKGGTHTMDNVAVSHKWCNLRKKAKFIPVQLALFGERKKLVARVDIRKHTG